MKTVPLTRPHLPKLDEIMTELLEMWESGQLTNFGKFSRQLEIKVCELMGVKYALCVSNATNGLMMLLNILPKGSEVLVPSFTFLPTIQAILWNSLNPVFVDIDAETYTISPISVASKLSSRTSAILAVNIFGDPCEIEELEKLTKEKRIRLFFDSAHAFGAKYNGKYVGGFGDAEVFSLSATKLLPCGEGGLITTNSDYIYKSILNRRNYGFTFGSRDCANMGLNGKITEFSAILGLKGIDSIDTQVQRRNEIAQKYIRHLSHLPGLSFQKVRPEDVSTYKDFTIAINHQLFGIDRDTFKKETRKKGVETEFYFSPAVHQMSYFQSESFSTAQLENTNLIEKKIISLPMYSDLSDEDFEYTIKTIQDIFRGIST